MPLVNVSSLADFDVSKLMDGESIRDEIKSNQELAALLKYYLLFTFYPELFEPITDADLIYNRYYWFRRLVTLFESVYGPDAGVEQQAFQILENANCELDWAMIQKVETMAVARVGP
ncbi:MAG: hypothetical protein KDA66_02770 [Planctomycetaceae bacterium]|nr:hypothetical protein [Planctomycetaceae bacterium]MCB9951330.1 hypothetical protein [Planctomycetaceae bacterium]